MSGNSFPFISDLYLMDNVHKDNITYRASNILSSNIYPSAANVQDVEDEPMEVGYISVGVFTASGALPVEDAIVTVYTVDNEGEENVISHLITDANGQVPSMELPIYYNALSPLENPEYYFSKYNLRVQAINYYTVNILDFRVFPNTTTNFNIEMIPAAIGPVEISPDMTYVIPPSPVDISN